MARVLVVGVLVVVEARVVGLVVLKNQDRTAIYFATNVRSQKVLKV